MQKNVTSIERRQEPLCSCVKTSLSLYLRDIDGHHPGNLHQLVISEVEKPLFETVLRYAQGNQTKAAAILGINRSTLRKKLEQYGLS